EAIKAADKAMKNNRTLRFNNLLDAAVAGVFLVLVVMVVLLSVTEWILLLSRKRLAKLCESEPVWLPAYAVAEGRPVHLFGLIALGLALLKELSGEAHTERVRTTLAECQCDQSEDHGAFVSSDIPGERSRAGRRQLDQRAFVQATEERFNGVRRCC